MANEEFYDDEFIINLTIDGTSYKEVEVKVTDPNETIRDLIQSIVSVFKLPKRDNGCYKIQYLLGQIIEDGEEPEILEFEDEDGREQCLMDYNIQPGDNLYLIGVPISGCPPIKVKLRGVAMLDGIVVNSGRLLGSDVATFIWYIVESYHLPLFDNGYYIAYSLSLWDRRNYIKCDSTKQLWEYVHILLRNDIEATDDLQMILSADKTERQSRLGYILERLYLHWGSFLYKKYKSIKLNK